MRYRDAAGNRIARQSGDLSTPNAGKLRSSSTSAADCGVIPGRDEIRLEKWATEWIQTRHDLRLTTRTRLEITLKVQVLPRFGTTPLVRIFLPSCAVLVGLEV